MSDKTSIGWTEATWNPTTGCSHTSEGCRYCYAEALSNRYGWTKKPWTAQNASENVVLHPERLDLPLHWKKPRRVFVDSMSDLFHEQVPFEFILDAWLIMRRAPHHVFQILTKRPERMTKWFHWLKSNLGHTGHPQYALPNIWLGVSVENQKAADERIPLLLQTPAAVRFVSCEPLLGPVKLPWLQYGFLDRRYYNILDWVIVGGESGSHARPMELDWLRSIAEQCQEAEVAIFVKQDSGRYPGKQGRIPDDLWKLKGYPA